MSDKDLLVVISEMLRMQDQQAVKLDQHSAILDHHTSILNRHTDILNLDSDIINQHTSLLRETHETLKLLTEVSIKRFQEDQIFNERFFDKLEDISKKI